MCGGCGGGCGGGVWLLVYDHGKFSRNAHIGMMVLHVCIWDESQSRPCDESVDKAEAAQVERKNLLHCMDFCGDICTYLHDRVLYKGNQR